MTGLLAQTRSGTVFADPQMCCHKILDALRRQVLLCFYLLREAGAMLASLTLATGSLVGCVLLVSGLQKLRSGDVVIAIANYNVLPIRLLRVAAPALPWIEVAVGTGLIVGAAAPMFLIAAAALLVVFCVGILVNLLRGRRIDCGCRGGSQPISWKLFSADLSLAVVCVTAASLNPSGLISALTGHAPLGPSDAVATLFALVTLWVTWLVANLGATAWRKVSSPPLATAR